MSTASQLAVVIMVGDGCRRVRGEPVSGAASDNGLYLRDLKQLGSIGTGSRVEGDQDAVAIDQGEQHRDRGLRIVRRESDNLPGFDRRRLEPMRGALPARRESLVAARATRTDDGFGRAAGGEALMKEVRRAHHTPPR